MKIGRPATRTAAAALRANARKREMYAIQKLSAANRAKWTARAATYRAANKAQRVVTLRKWRAQLTATARAALLLRRRETYAANRAALLAAAKTYRNAHRAALLAKQRAWYAENAERAKAACASWRAAHPEKHKAALTRWRRAHPEAFRHYAKTRRARKKRSADVRLTLDEWQALLTAAPICAYCGVKFTTALRPTMDHITPLARGGAHTKENIAVVCLRCNTSKGVKPLNVFKTGKAP